MHTDPQKGAPLSWAEFLSLEAGSTMPGFGDSVTDSTVSIVQHPIQPARFTCVEASAAEPTVSLQAQLYRLLDSHPPGYGVGRSQYLVTSAADLFLSAALWLNVQIHGYEGSFGHKAYELHPQVEARIAGHQHLLQFLAGIARRAAYVTQSELCRMRAFPDSSHEYDASGITVFEVVIRGSQPGRDVYWNALETLLTNSLAQLPAAERAFVAKNISVEVAEE